MFEKMVYYTGASFASLFVVPTLAICIPAFPILGIGLAGYTVLHILGVFPSLPLISAGISIPYLIQIVIALFVSGLLIVSGFASYIGLKKYIGLLAKRKGRARF